MSASVLRGVVAPILTPFNDDLSIATDLFLAHGKRLLAEGCAGLAPFGTTGEALSVGIDERIEALDRLIDGGIDPALLVPGTGLTALADTARLTAACLERGCGGVLLLPPFYYKGVSDEGLYSYFAQLIAAVKPTRPALYLYHIPPVAMVGLSPSLVRRLFADFPEAIAGIKDSSGDWANTQALLEIEGLVVYPGSELFLLDGLKAGSAGCITASANINAAAIAKVVERFDAGDGAGAEAQQAEISRFRKLIQGPGAIPGQKRLLAMETGDARWANLRPPLLSFNQAEGQAFAEKLGRAA
ncbi:MAG: dihydrodipicolinate synthase family protein [Kiloniellales bacterium]